MQNKTTLPHVTSGIDQDFSSDSLSDESTPVHQPFTHESSPELELLNVPFGTTPSSSVATTESGLTSSQTHEKPSQSVTSSAGSVRGVTSLEDSIQEVTSLDGPVQEAPVTDSSQPSRKDSGFQSAFSFIK